MDFPTNKRLIEEVAIIASKRLRNKIAGFTSHLMKRIQRGPVRGISFKLQVCSVFAVAAVAVYWSFTPSRCLVFVIALSSLR